MEVEFQVSLRWVIGFWSVGRREEGGRVTLTLVSLSAGENVRQVRVGVERGILRVVCVLGGRVFRQSGRGRGG